MSIKSAEMVQTGVMTVWCLPTLCLATESSSGGFCCFALQATLVQFIVEDWKRPINEGIVGRQCTICDMRQLFKFTAERLNDLNELHKVQDEADTRMLSNAGVLVRLQTASALSVHSNAHRFVASRTALV